MEGHIIHTPDCHCEENIMVIQLLCYMSNVCDRLVNAILNSVDLTCFQYLVPLPTYLPSFGHIMLKDAHILCR